MHQLFTASRVITPDEDLSPGWVLVRDGKFAGVGQGDPPAGDFQSRDLGSLTLVPGFVDIHVHGGGGFSLLSGDPDEAREYTRWAITTGVTSLLPTVCAGTPEDSLSVLRALAGLVGPSEAGAEILGVNLEGPFVAPERLGALPRSWLQPPDAHLFDRLADAAAGALRMITIAPEIEGAPAVIAAAQSRGVVPSVGHTDAGFDEASAAFSAGASHVTHALNAMRPFHHRDPSVVGAALQAPGVTIEVIADGVHLHRATVRMLLRAFGPERVALVTDAVTPAGQEHGTVRIGHEEATLRSGRITLPDGTIAGSAATMDALVRNVIDWTCGTLQQAVRMASTVPATVAGADVRKGRIAEGYDADIVALTPDLQVAAAWVRGTLAHSTIGPPGAV